MQMTKKNQLVKTVVLAGLVAMLGACSSQDRHMFVSTNERPTTVTVVNALKPDQVYWVREVPVGYQLKIDLDRAGEVEFFKVTTLPATSMQWTIVKNSGDDAYDPIGISQAVNHKTQGGKKDPLEEKSRMELPGTPVKIFATYRKAEREGAPLNPKYVPSTQPNTGPVKSEK